MSAWSEFKKKQGSTRPWHLLNKNNHIEDPEIFIKRIKTCHECPSFIELTGQCKECGCIMALKAKLKDAMCPLNKW